MSWLAILLAASVAAPAPAPRAHHVVAPHGRVAKKAPRHKGVRLTRRAPPSPGPAAAGGPAATPAPVATATPTAPPPPTVYPSRTRVVLQDDPYSLQSSYLTMKAGQVEFNVLNAGMDDHNLTIAGSGATVFTPPGEEAQLVAALPPGTYRLYCSLLNHEQLGMWTTLTVK